MEKKIKEKEEEQERRCTKSKFSCLVLSTFLNSAKG